jgi:hypothetical protein
MTTQLQDVNDLKSYLMGVIDRAEHHAPNVKQICLALAGAVVLYKDSDQPLEVRGSRGDFKNVLWAHINGTRYAFSYNHKQQTIEIRRGSLRGTPAASFSNQTPTSQILQIFDDL